MGTIHDQPERNNFDAAKPIDLIDESLFDAKNYKCKFSVSDLIEAKKALEMERANDISVEDGNYRDEHMAGIAEYLDRIATALETIAEKMK